MNIKLATISLNQTPLDWQGNQERIINSLTEAKEQGCNFLCYPELVISGYGCEDTFLSDYIYELSFDSLIKIIEYTEEALVVIGLPLKFEGRFYNVAAIIYDKKLLGFVVKHNLANKDVYYEPRWFDAWKYGDIRQFSYRGYNVPIGDCIIDIEGLAIGVEICEDAWTASHCKNDENYLQKADIVCNLSASHFVFDKQNSRRDLVVRRAKQLDCIYLYANLCGNEAGRIIYDGSSLIGNKNGIINEGERFFFDDYFINYVVINIEKSNLKFASDEDISSISKFNAFSLEQQFYLIETLGLFDYLRKSYSNGFILSLSGGVDSSVCAILVSLMIERAIKELGLKEFKKKFQYFFTIQEKNSLEEIKKEFLTCVYQATKNSGDVTKNAAESLAKELRVNFLSFDVENIVDSYRKLVEDGLGYKLSWEKNNLALQNIQARTRVPGIWMLANERNALLLSTSNRSEIAVGYATMDGDTAGGLAPIGGVNKTFLRKWLVILEKKGLEGFVIPMPIVALINKQKPTAELCPIEFKQSDEIDLMPYKILDFLILNAIGLRQSPLQVYKNLAKEFSLDNAQASLYTKKFFHLWSINQWKRERYAPSFHIDNESLDPKTWCRFPILNGAYKFELKQLP